MKMFRYLLYDRERLEASSEKIYWQRLSGELQEMGITCIPLDEKEFPDPRECFMLAMDENQVQQAKKCSMPVAALELPGQESISGVNTVLLGLEEVDADFLKRQYQRCMGIPWEILETTRCLVRELELSDLPELFELYAKPHVTDYLEPLYPYEEEYLYQKQYISQIYGYYGYGMWLVRHKATGALIGRAGLEQRVVGEETQLELGYVIAPEYWHQGYATEVCTAILEWAEEHLDFACAESMVEPGNEASIRLLNRLRFSYMGREKRDGQEFLHFRRGLQKTLGKKS